MNPLEKLRAYAKIFGVIGVTSGGGSVIAYNVSETYKSIGRIINTNVLDREKIITSEYIYIDDPLYDITLLKERDKENKRSVGLTRIWKSVKHSLAWRLLWLCRHGNREQRNIAIEQLAAFKNNKDWDCYKLAQAFDMDTAVLLARTRGADLRYFLPPPMHVRRAAKTLELLSYKYRDILLILQSLHPHSCIQQFLSKHFENVQEHVMDVDSVPTKPDRRSDRDLCLLCLDALYHHLSIFGFKDVTEHIPEIIPLEILPRIAELFLRYPNDLELDVAVLRVLTLFSVDKNLLVHFFQNGLIGELSRLIRSKDVRLASSAAVCLTNLSGECSYKPGLYLLHPLYRTAKQHVCDILLVHGLRGGVFVTWRQRDRKCAKPVGIADDIVIPENNCVSNSCEDTNVEKPYLADPELRQVIEDMIEVKDEALLADMEVVLQDIPEKAVRENHGAEKYFASKKRQALLQELEDRCSYTTCWPKEWLPQDCKNLRILGVNYWSSISEWQERCPLQTADIESRASELAHTLEEAVVGMKGVPVVWIAHSMGGLIVKQLLVTSAQSEDENVKQLSNNTKAVLFFSTPHKGSAVATMPRAASAVFWPSNDVRQLQENSPVLLETHNSFIKTADERNWETISFAETKATLVTAFKVPFHLVKPQSADLGRGLFYEVPLDHLSICKPESRQSILYRTVLDVLLRVTKNEEEIQHSYSYYDMVVDLWWKLQRKTKEALESIGNH